MMSSNTKDRTYTQQEFDAAIALERAGREGFERGVREGGSQIPSPQAIQEAITNGIEADIQRATAHYEASHRRACFIAQEAQFETRGVLTCVASRSPESSLRCVRVDQYPRWIADGTVLALMQHNKEVIAQIYAEIDQRVPQREAAGLRALRVNDYEAIDLSGRSREQLVQIESELATRRKQLIWERCSKPWYSLAGKLMPEIRRACSYLVELPEGQPIPEWHTKGQPIPDDVPAFPKGVR